MSAIAVMAFLSLTLLGTSSEAQSAGAARPDFFPAKGDPAGLALSPDGSTLYVAVPGTASVDVFDGGDPHQMPFPSRSATSLMGRSFAAEAHDSSHGALRNASASTNNSLEVSMSPAVQTEALIPTAMYWFFP